MDQEHEESWCMRISNRPLSVRVKLVFLVVNSFKLLLTALASPTGKLTCMKVKYNCGLMVLSSQCLYIQSNEITCLQYISVLQ